MQVPGGRLLISATLEAIDGVGGMTGSAGVGSVWSGCSAVSATGTLKFDMADVAVMEADGIFEGVVMHEMGHVIGIGYDTERRALSPGTTQSHVFGLQYALTYRRSTLQRLHFE